MRAPNITNERKSGAMNTQTADADGINAGWQATERDEMLRWYRDQQIISALDAQRRQVAITPQCNCRSPFAGIFGGIGL